LDSSRIHPENHPLTKHPEPTVPDQQVPVPPADDSPRGALDGDRADGRADEAESAARGELPPPVSGDRSWPQPAKSRRAADFWALAGCNAIVFGASVCIMVLELTASRLIAAYIGSSLYTWTSVIGVVLAGISIGNYCGGWLADRYPPQRVLAWLFLISGLLTCSVILLNNVAASLDRPDWIYWPWWVMLMVACVFYLPALSLGTISPVTASMALKRSAKTGMTVGNIYAWGALGSIVGTFLTGFWLIGEFGSSRVIGITACALVLMGYAVAGGQRVFRAVALFGALPLIFEFALLSSITDDEMSGISRGLAGIRSGWRTTPADFEADEEAERLALEQDNEKTLDSVRERQAWRQERKASEDEWAKWGEKLGWQLHELGRTLALRRDNPQEYNDESNYYAINIAQRREERTGDLVKVLHLDHLIHSYWNPDQPTRLYYDYERVYAAITERAAASSDKETTCPLDNLPAGDEFPAAFPPAVKYDRQAKKLSVHGTMQFEDLRRLLTIGPHARFARALYRTFEEAQTNWHKASHRNNGILWTEIPELPEGVVFPYDVGVKVHYDSFQKALICTAPFSLQELVELLAQGQMREYVEAVWELFNSSRQASALFIGGGGFVFPRWIEHTFPEKPLIDVAEIDPAVQLAVEKELGLPTEYGSPEENKTYVRTHIGDARKFVDDQVRENRKRTARGALPVTYDFVYGDAFNDLSVPWHLTTREFSEKVAQLLTPGKGVYLVNIIDIYPRAASPRGSHKPGEPEALLRGPLPLAVVPEDLEDDDWEDAAAPSGLQVFRSRGGEFRVGFRGVMSIATRDALRSLPGADEAFRAAVDDLYQQSLVEKTGQFLGRYVNTARKVFPYVYLFSSNEDGPGHLRDTFIVACSLQKLDFDNLVSSGGHWETGPFAWTEQGATEGPGNEMQSVLELARDQVLKDDFAPLDNLLAPVFVDRDRD
jgi:hypothetical protein